MSTDFVHTAFDGPQRERGCEFMDWEGWLWPNHFGDPVAEHRAVRDGRRHLGRVAAAQVGLPRARRAARRRPDLHERHARPRDGPDPLCAVLRRGRQDGRRRHRLQIRRGARLGDHRARLRPRAVPGRRRRAGRGDRADHRRVAPPAAAGSARARPARRSDARRRADSATSASSRSRFASVAFPPGSRAQAIPERPATRSSAHPETAPALWDALTGAGATPYGLAAVETLRIESGLVFIGYDYFQHETDPFDVSLDKVVRLDTGDFAGKQALAETAKSPPRRMVTLALDGGDVPEYGAAVSSDGEPAGTLTSPCESPTLGKVIGLAVLEKRFAERGTRARCRRRRTGDRRASADLRPGQAAATGLRRGALARRPARELSPGRLRRGGGRLHRRGDGRGAPASVSSRSLRAVTRPESGRTR